MNASPLASLRDAGCRGVWDPVVSLVPRSTTGYGLSCLRHADIAILAERRYEMFDTQRREAEARDADREDIEELEAAEKKLLKKPEGMEE